MLMLKELCSKTDQMAKGLQRSQDLRPLRAFILYFILSTLFFSFRFSFNILPLCDYTYIILVFFNFSVLARCDNKLRRQNLSVKNKINR